MARLPTPGQDSGQWGDILNDYLSQSHKTDGSLKDNSVGTSQLQDNAVTASAIADDAVTAAQIVDGSIQEAQLSSTVATKLNAPATINDGSVAKTKLKASVQDSLGRADTAVQKAELFLRFEDYGAIGNGVTDDTAAIRATLAAHLETGKPIRATDGATFRSTEVIYHQGKLRLYGGATFLVPAYGNLPSGVGYARGMWQIAPAMSSAVTVSSFAKSIYPSTGGTVSSFTVPTGASFTAGDVLMIMSDDTYAYQAGCKKAELAQVAGQVGTTVYLSRPLLETYAINPTAKKLSDDTVVIDGPTFVGNGDIDDNSIAQRRETLSIWGAVSPTINVTVRNGFSKGVTFYSCFKPVANINAHRIRDNVAINAYGYGVVAAGATFGGDFTVQADKVRHAYTTNAGDMGGPDALKGVPLANTTRGTGIHTTSAAFDTHEALYQRFENCRALWQSPDPNNSTVGQVYSFQDRGFNTRWINCSWIGANNGFIDSVNAYDYASGYPGLTFEVVINGLDGVNPIADSAVSSSTNAGIAHQTSSYTKPQYRFSNLRFINILEAIAWTAGVTYYIKDAYFRNNFKNRLGNYTYYNLENIERHVTASGQQQERFVLTSNIYAFRAKRLLGNGNTASPSLVYASGGGTIPNVDIEDIRLIGSTNAYTVLATDGATILSGQYLDAYRPADYASIPTNGYWMIGQKARNIAPVAGGYAAWVCVTEGQAAVAWIGSTVYTLNATATNNGRTYQATTAGTSASSGGPAATGTNITDGSVVWRYVNSAAVFKGTELIAN